MRAPLILFALTGCSSILGISDPSPAGDGGPDMMVDSNIDAPPPCTTSISLKADVTSDIGAPGTGVAFGDFDNGGVDDIVVARGTDAAIFHGDNMANFGADGDIKVIATAATNVVIGDWDIVVSADDDFALFTVGGTSVVARRQNRALDPPVEAEQPLTGPFANVQRVFAGGFGGNGNDDLVVYDGGGSRVYTASGITPGDFIRSANVFAPAADELLFIQQIDSDAGARADALFVNGSDVKLSLQTGAGFQALGTITTSGSKGIAIGKFDGDALVDLVISTSSGLELWRQIPATPGTFMKHGIVSPLMSATPMQVADLNGDGRDDIVLVNAAILQCAPLAPGGPGVFTQVEALNAMAPTVFRDVTNDTLPDLVRIEGQSVKVRAR